ncbi:MAG: DUF6488 family protein [Oligoflexia bacterium]|nr:DUF6488 family protein [Oligoflexia bacterium]
MKIFVNMLVLGVGLAVGAVPGFAGSGHSHGPGGSHDRGLQAQAPAPVGEAKIVELANAEVRSLAGKGKLEESWGKAGVSKVSQEGPLKHWVVQYENVEIRDVTKRRLYVIISEDGVVKAVNFKGVQKPHSHGSGTPHLH